MFDDRYECVQENAICVRVEWILKAILKSIMFDKGTAMSERISTLKVLLLSALGAGAGVLLVLGVHHWLESDDATTASAWSEAGEDPYEHVADRADIDAHAQEDLRSAPGAERVPSPAAMSQASDTATSPPNLMRLSSAQMFPMTGGGPELLRSQCSTNVNSASSDSGSDFIRIECLADEPSFGGMFSPLNAAGYRGKQVRLSMELMAQGIRDSAQIQGLGALWIRIDTPDGPVVRNAREDSVQGSTQWVHKETSVEVPENATQISFGVWMQGRGELYARNIAVEAM